MADDADATEARKKARQGDNDHAEELSDEEMEMVKELDKELLDEPIEADLDQSAVNSRSVTPNADKDEGIEEDLKDESDDEESHAKVNPENMNTRDAQRRRLTVLNKAEKKDGKNFLLPHFLFPLMIINYLIPVFMFPLFWIVISCLTFYLQFTQW